MVCLLALLLINDIPPFASIAGITVGLTTMEAAERKLGRAKISIGGHSNSRHTWFFKNGLVLSTDGFNYDRMTDCLVVDEMHVDWIAPSTYGRKSPKMVGFWKDLRAGMPIAEVRALKWGKYHPVTSDDKIEVSAKGLSKFAKGLGNKDSDRFVIWKADVYFDNGKLTGVTIVAD